jgi:hypothetical protein
MLVSDGVEVEVEVDVVSCGVGVIGAGREEGGGEGLRRAVKSTADGERCIRARTQFVPQDDRLSWGESSTRPKDSQGQST